MSKYCTALVEKFLSFWSLVLFMVKWVLATLPAFLLVLVFVSAIAAGLRMTFDALTPFTGS